MSLPDKKRRLRRAWLVFGSAVVLGPMLGGVIFVALTLLLDGARAGSDSIFAVLPKAVTLGVLGGYLFGILPSFFAGLFAALWSLTETGLTWRRVAVCAIAGSALGSSALMIGFNGRIDMIVMASLCVLSVFVASILWFAMRKRIGAESGAVTGNKFG